MSCHRLRCGTASCMAHHVLACLWLRLLLVHGLLAWVLSI
jgi:hypothetical protein